MWIADVTAGTVRQAPHPSWDLAALLEKAEALPGTVLIGVDLALGLPAGFAAGRSFVDWLASDAGARALAPEATVTTAEAWSPATPFFRVPPGAGSLTAYRTRAGFPLKRTIDDQFGAKEMFIVSGIPGTVGAGTRAFWQELRPQLAGRHFGLWPFDGALEPLLAERRVVLAEMYPGLAYTAALADAVPHRRLRVAKTGAEVRRHEIERLERAPWVATHGVQLHDLDAARASEDDFDAAMFACAALRCLRDGHALEGAVDPIAEGGMLLSGTVRPR